MSLILSRIARSCFLLALCLPARATTLGLATEDFQFHGDWSLLHGARGVTFLIAPQKPGGLAAATAISVPKAGKYRLWVRSLDFPTDRPGTRTFHVSIAGKPSPETFGKSGQADWAWERGGDFDLPAGQVLIALDRPAPFARCQAVLLTDDLKFTPTLPVGRPQHPRVTPVDLPISEAAHVLPPDPVTDVAATQTARIENEFLRIDFAPAKRAGRDTLAPRVSVKSADGQWLDARADASAEAYVVVVCPPDTALHYAGAYPRWQGGPAGQPMTIQVAGAKVETRRGLRTSAIWDAGVPKRFIPRSATVEGHRARLEFHPDDAGTLTAEWELRPGEHAARVKLSFIPATAGQFSLGYHAPLRRPLADVDELLLPLQWQRKRFPSQAQTILDPVTPTPVSLAQVTNTGNGTAPVTTWAVIADPSMLPFAWPNPDAPHLGLNIREEAGRVQPAIYAPVPGTPAAKPQPGRPIELSLRVLATPGDWYAAYRVAADEVFGFRDYRSNVRTSLSDAALNMIDLLKDDRAGGWWARGKGAYQIETKNGVTDSAPMLPLSLYRLTGDVDLYNRRALPAIEFALSRTLPHFSPIPSDTGPYPAGGMDGPIKTYGSALFAGLWELGGRQSESLREIAFPAGATLRETRGMGHTQPFDDYLARYKLTGDAAALAKARELADKYIADHVTKPPTGDLGPQPFFFISFVPDWDGLLDLYETTGDKRYLGAASFGARQLMTGVWTQPLFPAGDVTIHPTGQFPGDHLGSWRGADHYRLGTPRKPNDTPAHDVPAWVVSNVGLSFEQPSTIRGRGQDRLIYQMGWSAAFLRLARHTGDATFATYARNAVIGRFANYPGYYATGLTDLPLNPRYPYDGPDVTDFYYHHIAPHLAWTIDYLVADAQLRSKGQVDFPSLRQYGYAYFDSRIFGHAPGRIYGDAGAWLWLRRGLVTVDNPQLNTLTAHGDNRFYAILTNQNDRPESATVTFDATTLNFDPAAINTITVISQDGTRSQQPLTDTKAKVGIPAKGLAVLVLDGVKVDVPAHRPSHPAAQHGTSRLALKAGDKLELRAAALPGAPGIPGYNAYLWSTATPADAREVTIRYRTAAGDWTEVRDSEYPFELSVPVNDPTTPFEFKAEIQTPKGSRVTTDAGRLTVR